MSSHSLPRPNWRRRVLGVYIVLLFLSTVDAPAASWPEVKQALAKVERESDRKALLWKLQSNKPEKVEEALASLMGWVLWDKYGIPPDVSVRHSLTHADLLPIVQALLKHMPNEPGWGHVCRFILAWANNNKASGISREVLRLVTFDDWEIRVEALKFVGRFQMTDVESDIAALLKDRSYRPKGEVVRTLMRLHNTSELPTFLKLIKTDRSGHVQEAVLSCTREMTDVYMPPITKLLTHADKDVVYGAMFVCRDLGHAKFHIPQIIGALGHKDRRIRELAVETLLALDPKQQSAALLATLKNGSDLRRQNALKVLSQLYIYEAVPAIVAELKAGRNVRAAIEALATLGAHEHIDDIAKHINVPAAIDALGRLNAQGHVETIADLLDGEDTLLKERAALALARLGDERCIEPIQTFLSLGHHSGSWELREALLVLNHLRHPDVYDKLRRSPTIFPADPSAREVTDLLKDVTDNAGLKLKLARSARTAAGRSKMHLRQPTTSLDRLWQMSFASWSYILDDKQLRVLSRRDAINFWQKWLQRQQERQILTAAPTTPVEH